MEKATWTVTKRWKVPAAILSLAAATLWLTTNGNNITSILNNLSNLRKKPPATTVVAVSPVPSPSSIVNNLPSHKTATMHPATASISQVSTGNQSPNIANVQGSVRLQYSGPTVPQSSPSLPSAPAERVVVVGKDRYPTQVSTGAQSPNISGVNKDVEIKYDLNSPNR